MPNSGYSFQKEIEFTDRKDPKSFLFFGSTGVVHKGLALLLEIFSQKNFPCKLYVCGPYEIEKEFISFYKNELYRCENIIPMGFVDIMSEDFRKIAEECCYTILPSCSEGMAGSVTTCMSAGIVPICSRECGFDAEEVIILKNCRKESIESKILECSSLNIDDIRYKSLKARELVSKKYNINEFYKNEVCDRKHY